MCSKFNEEVENVTTNGDDSVQKSNCKCGSEDIILSLSLYGSFCRECFLQRVAHKFRLEFGKSRLIRDSENVAVAFSGGKKSTAMVNLILEGCSKRAQKKLRFHPTLICILEPKRWESSYEIDSNLIEGLFSSELPFFVYGLNQVFDDDPEPILSSKENLANINIENIYKKLDFSKSYNLKKSFKQPTSTESIISLMRKEFLLKICRKLKFSKILMGDTARQLAMRLISFVSQGRGNQLSYEMEFADSRNTDVIFVKPMRAFLDEEIITLLDLKKLRFTSNSAEKWEVQTIDSLTEEFINKLQAENDKTLSILCRTGEKLTVSAEKDSENDGEDKDGEMACCLCKAFIEKTFSNGSKLSANYATELSISIANQLKLEAEKVKNVEDAMVSSPQKSYLQSGNQLKTCTEINYKSNGDDLCRRNTGCGSDGCCSEDKRTYLFSKDDIMTCLCYGCRILVKDMSDVNKLPFSVLKEVQKKLQRRVMKESIEEFLLKDSLED